MLPRPRSAPSAGRRLLALAFVAVFSLAAFLALTASHSAAAAPGVPYFSANVKVDQVPAYTAGVPSLAVGSDGVAYLAFAGWGGTTTGTDVFFAKSADGGRTWTVPLKVNDDTGAATQTNPSLALDVSNDIHIAWTDYRTGTANIEFAKSTDGGLSFSANVRVNDVLGNARDNAAVAVDNQGLVHVVWTDTRNAATTGPDIYYANSTDGGLSFNPNARINNDLTAAEQGRPVIAVDHSRTVYVVWQDPRNPAKGTDVYFSESADLGNTWSANAIVNDDSGGAAQINPRIAVNGTGTIFVVWQDYRNPNTSPDIYASRSTNGGSSFTANVEVNDDLGIGFQGNPSLAVNAGTVQAAWTDGRTVGSTGYDIYTASSADGITWSANQKVNDDTIPFNYQGTPTVGLDAAGDVFAAWFDMRSSGQDVYAGTLDVVPPVAVAGPAQSVGQGAVVTLNGSASSDNLGIAGHIWDFGDGASANGMTVTHAYATPGTYTATLTVTDDSGNTARDSLLVTVRDTRPPVAQAGGNRIVDVGQPLYFDASASTDNVGVVSYQWNFGDGANASAMAVTHIYSAPGTYNVTLTVQDAAGNSATARITVTVRVVSPTTSELMGQIQLLYLLLGLLALALVIVAFLAVAVWRRRKPEPSTPKAGTPPAGMTPPPVATPQEPDPIDLPPPPPEAPKGV